MLDAWSAAMVPGLALGGVLAAGAAWSRAARLGPLPHLGVGAFAGLGVVIALRLQGLPGWAVLLVVAIGGGLAGGVAHALDVRLRSRPGPAADHPGLADLALLALLVGAAALLAPLMAVPLPFGPLGGLPSGAGAIATLAVGATAAVLLAGWGHGGIERRDRPEAPLEGWVAAAAGLAVAGVLAAGAVAGASPTMGALTGLPDTMGLAVRTAAAALAARRGPLDAAAAGFGLGMIEHVVRLSDPLGTSGFLPALGVLALGLLLHVARPHVRRPRPGGPARGARPRGVRP